MRIAAQARIEKQKRALQLRQPGGQNRHDVGRHAVSRAADVPEAAVRAEVLILDADAFPHQLLLDVHRFRRELLGGAARALERVQRVQESDGERRGRPEPGAGRQVADVVDLDVPIDPGKPQAGADSGMLDLVNRPDQLGSRVADADRMLEEIDQRLDRDVGVAVDRRPEALSAVLAEMIRVVGAAPEEADAERGPGHDHRLRPGGGGIRRQPLISSVIPAASVHCGAKPVALMRALETM